MPHTLNKNVGYRIYGCEKTTTEKTHSRTNKWKIGLQGFLLKEFYKIEFLLKGIFQNGIFMQG